MYWGVHVVIDQKVPLSERPSGSDPLGGVFGDSEVR
jgi:hypothetical protein